LLISAFSKTRAFHEEIIAKKNKQRDEDTGKPEEQKQKRRFCIPS
jgi:hypothetical protein